MATRSLITGVNGQDGAYLARLLIEKGHGVVGSVRNTATSDLGRLQELGIAGDIELIDLDLGDIDRTRQVIARTRADEIYNLAGQSYVGRSFEHPVDTGQINGISVIGLLEGIRNAGRPVRYYQASSCEMFGYGGESLQDERTAFHPRSPYAIAKAYAHWMTVNYRDSYGMHAINGILFNHESPLRGQGFVTRKITLGFAKMRHAQLDVLELGNLDARRDWGFAGDYVEGMRRMLEMESPDDYVLATGQTHSVRDFVAHAGRHFGFDIEWRGNALEEHGVDRKTGRTVVQVNPKLFRPTDVDALCGDAGKARRELGWVPRVAFADLVGMMAEADARRVRDGTVGF